MSEEIGHVYIPAHIMACKELTILEKVLFGKIVGLSTTDGYCFASNGWLGKQLDKDERTIRRWITKLVELGFVVREVERNEKQEIVKRKLFPVWKQRGRALPQVSDDDVSVGTDNNDRSPLDKSGLGIQEIDPRDESGGLSEKTNNEEKPISEQIKDGTWVPVVTHTPQGDYVFRN